MVSMLIRWMIGRTMDEKLQRRKQRLAQEREEHAEMMCRVYGSGRYAMSQLIGPWALYAFRKPIERTEEPEEKEFVPEYTKFYRDLKIAQRYEKMQRKKWDDVRIVPSYDANNNINGYFLYAAGKIQL